MARPALPSGRSPVKGLYKHLKIARRVIGRRASRGQKGGRSGRGLLSREAARRRRRGLEIRGRLAGCGRKGLALLSVLARVGRCGAVSPRGESGSWNGGSAVSGQRGHSGRAGQVCIVG